MPVENTHSALSDEMIQLLASEMNKVGVEFSAEFEESVYNEVVSKLKRGRWKFPQGSF